MFSALIRIKRSLSALRLSALLLTGVLLTVSSGCGIMQTCGCYSPSSPPVNEVTAMWKDQIYLAANSENGGRPMPGLAGRVWLGCEQVKGMVEADGMIFAELIDETPGSEGRKLADWRFDKDNLKLLKRNDIVGMGYTLFLPWETYDPRVKRVQLLVAYQESHGTPHFVYAEPQLLTLKRPEQQPLIQQVEYTWTPDQFRQPPAPLPK
ncbi:MAG TPA: hypothetical protein VFE62_30190 [Gemmataceae bacterium]|nr:hypothetical protein [Gemmataceae bacterium]